MFWKELRSGVHACLRPAEGANVGLIRADAGWILVDTGFCAMDLLAALDARGIVLADLDLAFNSHFHADHCWGNQLVHAPILGHRRCKELMEEMLKGPWSRPGIANWLDEIEHTHPAQARRCRERLSDLKVTPPNLLFEDKHTLVVGGSRLEFIHMGGHSPDLCVLWLPDEGLLFASDLLFEGRYPYLIDADIPAWIEALDRLRALGPETIVPGHGAVCGLVELDRLSEYLQGTWAGCAKHLARGRGLEAMLADTDMPRHGPEHADTLHEANIRHIYEVQTGKHPAAAASGGR